MSPRAQIFILLTSSQTTMIVENDDWEL